MIKRIAIGMLAAAAARCQPGPPAEPSTIAECLATIEKAPRQSADQKPLMAGKCLARFPLSATHGRDLLDLSKLLAEADQAENARAAIEKRLAEPGLGDSDRGDALLMLVTVAQRGSRTDEIRPRSIRAAAEVAPRIDKLGDGARWQQLIVYRWLNSYYRGDPDENGKVFQAASRYMDLFARQEPAKQKDSEAIFGLYCAYENLAGVYSTRGENERAKAILREGMERVTTASLVKSLQKCLLHYELVGKPAPPIEAPIWINAPPDHTVSFNGKVTLVEFTAHWCIPCRETYPSLMRLNQQFASRGVQILLATRLYGYFGKDHGLTPEQELAADRKYFVEEHQVSLPVAVARNTEEDRNAQAYGMQSIPLIAVIDRTGVVHRFVMGVTPSEEAALSKMLEDLLKP